MLVCVNENRDAGVMAKTETVWNAVERAATRRGEPRLELWERTIHAMLAGELPFATPAEHPERMPGGHQRPWPDWLADVHTSVKHHNDPTPLAPIFSMLTVQSDEFRKWLHGEFKPRRGPKPGANNFRNADEKLFPEIDRLLRSHKAGSAWEALLLIEDRKGPEAIPGRRGSQPESRRKRVLRRYLAQ